MIFKGMPEFEEFLDVLTAICVLIIISVIITLVWMSTYVRDQSVIATAVVVFQQDSTPTSSVTNHTRESTNPMDSSTQTVECDTSISSVPGSSETGFDSDPSSKQEEKHCEENVQLTDQTFAENLETPEYNSKSSSEIQKSVTIDSENKNYIPEGEDSSTTSILRQRKFDSGNATKETVIEKEPADGMNSSIEDQSFSEEFIRIKLKFLDDTHRLVRGQLTDEVGSFKRANFDPELSSNRVVRLIFNGQLLNRDNSTLGQYGLFDNCVVHCHISQVQSSNSSDRNESVLNRDNDGLDLSDYLNPLLLLIVVILWYLRYEYSHIFNTSATIVLVCLTALLLISQYALVLSFNISLGLDGGNGSNNGNDVTSVNSSILSANSGSTVEHISQPNSMPSTSPQIQISSSSASLEEQHVADQALENSQTKNDNPSCTDPIPSIQNIGCSVSGDPNCPVSNPVHESNSILLSS